MTVEDYPSMFPEEVSKVFNEYQGLFMKAGECMGGFIGASLAIFERSGLGERCVDHLTTSVRAFGEAGQELRGMHHSQILTYFAHEDSRDTRKTKGGKPVLFQRRTDRADC